MTRKEFDAVKAAVTPLKEAWNDPEKLKYRLDELGKIVQTTEGTGTEFDPYKYWKDGMAVESGKWYQCGDESGYIWEAKKDGVPTSDTDREYWDIPEGVTFD